LLVEVMKQMGKLTKVVLVIPEFHTDVFEAAFKGAEIVLPKVDALVLGPYCEFMVGMCPNVTAISTYGLKWLRSERSKRLGENTINLINIVSAASNVTRLEIKDYWKPDLLNCEAACSPSLGVMLTK